MVPVLPKERTRTSLISTAVRALTSVLPSSTVLITFSICACSLPTRIAARLSWSISACTRPLEAAVIAVSEAEKNPEHASSRASPTISMIMVSIPKASTVGSTSKTRILSGDRGFQQRRDRLMLGMRREEGLADAAGKHEGDASVLDLLVLAHVADQRFGRPFAPVDPGGRGRQADAGQMPLHPCGIFQRREAQTRREIEREHHADRDRLAMQQLAGIATFGFERVGEGMAEIEQGALAALLTLIGGDDRRLGAAAGQDGLAPQRIVAVDEIGGMAFQPGEESGIVDEPVFRDL